MSGGLAALRLLLRHPLPAPVRRDDDLLNQVIIMINDNDFCNTDIMIITRPAITTILSCLVLKEAFGIVEIGTEMTMTI